MLNKKLVMMFATIIAFTGVLAAQEQPQKVIKHTPIAQTSPSSGQEMYKSYCAVCHGVAGKGDGPAASALKSPPADLTLLSKNKGGKFPALEIAATLHGEGALPVHGSREMPVWGPLFRGMSGGHDSEVQQRISNLTKYIESLQEK